MLIILSIFPDISHNIPSFFGFGRGLDFFMVTCIPLILYLIFRIFTKLEELDSRITRLAGNIALKESGEDKKPASNKESKKKEHETDR